MNTRTKLRYLRSAWAQFNRGRMPKLMPSYVVLTDRTLGTKWALSQDATPAAVVLEAFNSRTHTNRAEYEAYQEPRAWADPNYRLVLDNGVLSMEYDPLGDEIGSISQQRLLTRSGRTRKSLEIDVDASGAITLTLVQY